MAEGRHHRSDTTEFATRLRELRIQHGWTQQQLADRIWVTAAAIGAWESGRCFPALRRRARVCEVLGASPQDLHLPPFDSLPSSVSS